MRENSPLSVQGVFFFFCDRVKSADGGESGCCACSCCTTMLAASRRFGAEVVRRAGELAASRSWLLLFELSRGASRGFMRLREPRRSLPLPSGTEFLRDEEGGGTVA